MLCLARGRVDQVNTPSPPPVQLCSCVCLLPPRPCSKSDCVQLRKGAPLSAASSHPHDRVFVRWVCIAGWQHSLPWMPDSMAGMLAADCWPHGLVGSAIGPTFSHTYFPSSGQIWASSLVACNAYHVYTSICCNTSDHQPNLVTRSLLLLLLLLQAPLHRVSVQARTSNDLCLSLGPLKLGLVQRSNGSNKL